MATTPLHVLRVFTGLAGSGGNPLGVFLDGAAIPELHRQEVARDLGFSETVFVLGAPLVLVYTPATRLPFAGHPLVGTAWLLARSGQPVESLLPPAGEVPVWTEGRDWWIRGRAEWAPPMRFEQHRDAAEVEALRPSRGELVVHWAWRDQQAGLVRSRVFAPDLGIAEDEATGAAAVRLVTALNRPVEITQGTGSRILARPGPDGSAEVGGLVALDEVRDFSID